MIVLALVFLGGIYFIYAYSFVSVPTSSPHTTLVSTNDDTSCPNVLIQKGSQLYMYNTNIPEESGKNPVLFNSLDDYIHYVKVQRTEYGKHCPILFLQQESNTQGDDVYRVRPGPFDLEAGRPTPIVASPTQIAAVQSYFSNNVSNKTGVMPTNMNIIGPSPGVNQPVQGFTSASFSEKQQTVGGAPPPSIPLINAQSPPIISGGVGVPVPIPNLPMPKPVPYVDANTDNPPYNSNEHYGFDPYGQYQGIFTTIDAIHDETQFQTTNGFSDNAMDPNWGGVLFTANQVATGKYDDNIVAPPVYSGAPNVYVNPSLLLPTTALPGSVGFVEYSQGSLDSYIINPQVDATNNIQQMNYNYSGSLNIGSITCPCPSGWVLSTNQNACVLGSTPIGPNGGCPDGYTIADGECRVSIINQQIPDGWFVNATATGIYPENANCYNQGPGSNPNPNYTPTNPPPYPPPNPPYPNPSYNPIPTNLPPNPNHSRGPHHTSSPTPNKTNHPHHTSSPTPSITPNKTNHPHHTSTPNTNTTTKPPGPNTTTTPPGNPNTTTTPPGPNTTTTPPGPNANTNTTTKPPGPNSNTNATTTPPGNAKNGK
jgi:hypothetical protein